MTVPEMFAATVARIPDRMAVSGELSYRQLDERARRWLTVLTEHDVESGERVAVCLPRGVDTLALALACWLRGAVFVPIDHSYPIARIRMLLADCMARLVFTAKDLGLNNGEVRDPTKHGELVVVDGSPNTEPTDPGRLPAPADPAYVLYTSGSTGRPKGVVVSHGALGHYVRCAVDAYPGASGLSPWHSTLSFDATVTSVWVPLAAGGSVQVIAEDTPLSGIEGVASLLCGQAPVGLLKMTPSHLDALDRWLDGEPLGVRIGTLVVGGEQLHPALLRSWLPRAELVINEYGPTEATVGATIARLTEADLQKPGDPLPVGRPLPGTTVYLLGPDDRPVPTNGSGEICIAGPQLAEGYLNLPEATETRFRPSVAVPDVRLYRTGDMGQWGADGALRFLGRLDDQIKHRGHRMEPGEIEAVLEAQLGVRQAMVVHQDGVLIGYVSRDSHGGAEITPRLLRSALRSELPRQLVPEKLIILDKFPLTGNGKVDRDAIKSGRNE